MSNLVNYSIHTRSLVEVNYHKHANEPAYGMAFQINSLDAGEVENAIQSNHPKQFLQYGILWIKKGGGMLKVDLELFEIKDHMMFCFSPGQIILISSQEPIYGYLISFSAEFLFLSETQTNASFLERLFEAKKVIYPDLEMQYELGDIVRKMQKEFEGFCELKNQILKGLLKLFVIYISRSLDTENQQTIQDRDTEMVRKFTTLIKKHFLTKKMVVDYARELCVSPNYLNRIVKKISGFTASYHIQQHIILEAKRQAIYSGLSMKEVAYLLGFNDYAHFSKFFKNNSGINFTCYKNAIQ